MKKITTFFLIFLMCTMIIYADNGKKVFETYCWGCHHQTAMAFGPSFSQIASQRTVQEIQAMIVDPEAVSKLFGYKRNAMPPFTLTSKELKAITTYILSFKESDEDNSTKDYNKTIVEEPYPNIAKAKELH